MGLLVWGLAGCIRAAGIMESISSAAVATESLTVDLTLEVPEAQALTTAALSAEGLVAHCEDFSNETVGASCEMTASGSCSLTGFTTSDLETGLVCIVRQNNWWGAQGEGIPIYSLVLPTSDEIAATQAGAALPVTISTATSLAYAAVTSVCPDGPDDCGTVDVAGLASAIVSLIATYQTPSDTSITGYIAALGAAYENALLTIDDTSDPTELLSGALAGEDDPDAFIALAGDSEVSLTDTLSFFQLVIEAILNGEDPLEISISSARSSRCTDAESCSALYDGTCNGGYPWMVSSSYDYDDLIDMGVPVASVPYLSQYSEEGDTCLTVKALSLACNDDSANDAMAPTESDCEFVPRCYDASSCETRYPGSCNPPADPDNPAQDSSWSYSDITSAGLTMEQAACLSAFTESTDACLTMEAVIANQEADDPCGIDPAEMDDGGGILSCDSAEDCTEDFEPAYLLSERWSLDSTECLDSMGMDDGLLNLLSSEEYCPGGDDPNAPLFGMEKSLSEDMEDVTITVKFYYVNKHAAGDMFAMNLSESEQWILLGSDMVSEAEQAATLALRFAGYYSHDLLDDGFTLDTNYSNDDEGRPICMRLNKSGDVLTASYNTYCIDPETSSFTTLGPPATFSSEPPYMLRFELKTGDAAGTFSIYIDDIIVTEP